MATKKNHINNEAELLKAMRSTGYLFPTNDLEQKMSLKLQPEVDFTALGATIDPTEIWAAEEPRAYKRPKAKLLEMPSTTFEEHWGIAAKGDANISKEIMDKIKKNQDSKRNGGDPK